MTTEQILDYFKTVSIRGRMAFGIHCLENALAHYGYHDPLLEMVLERLREFVESEQKLNIWDERIMNVTPLIILDDYPGNFLDEYETVSEEQALGLKDIYEQMPDALRDLIDYVIYIGHSNLYGGVGEYSSSSLERVSSVMEEMRSLKLPLPDLSPYTISPFTEWGGWGFVRPMSEFTQPTTA